MNEQAAAKMSARLVICTGAIIVAIGVIARAMTAGRADQGDYGLAYAVGFFLMIVGLSWNPKREDS